MYNRGFNARAGGVHENGLQTFKTFEEAESVANPYEQGNLCFNQAAGSSDQQKIQGLTWLSVCVTTKHNVVQVFWKIWQHRFLFCLMLMQNYLHTSSRVWCTDSCSMSSFSASKLLNHLPLKYLTRDLLPLNNLTHDLLGHTIFFLPPVSFFQTLSPVNSVKMVILSQRPGASWMSFFSLPAANIQRLDKRTVGKGQSVLLAGEWWTVIKS